MRQCSARCSGSEPTDAVTTAGQWVNSSTPLKIAIAMMGRVTLRQTRARIGTRKTERHIHAGMPATSSGAATSV